MQGYAIDSSQNIDKVRRKRNTSISFDALFIFFKALLFLLIEGVYNILPRPILQVHATHPICTGQVIEPKPGPGDPAVSKVTKRLQ